MKPIKQLSIVISLVLLQMAASFSSSTLYSRQNIAFAVAPQQSKQLPYTILHYRNYKDIYQEINAIDVDLTSMQLVVDTAATTPLRKEEVSSPIISLHNIQDYQRHVINKPQNMCIIHFTDRYECKELEAYKQMATSITNRNHNNKYNNRMKIKFFSVHIDEKDDNTAVLKDMLQIKHMPKE